MLCNVKILLSVLFYKKNSSNCNKIKQLFGNVIKCNIQCMYKYVIVKYKATSSSTIKTTSLKCSTVMI